MSNVNTVNRITGAGESPPKAKQGKTSLRDWLKRKLPWLKKRKKKDLEIYPLF